MCGSEGDLKRDKKGGIEGNHGDPQDRSGCRKVEKRDVWLYKRDTVQAREPERVQ